MKSANTLKLVKYRTQNTSVLSAETAIKDKKKGEGLAEKRAKQKKRIEIGDAYPWIGEVLTEIHPEDKILKEKKDRKKIRRK